MRGRGRGGDESLRCVVMFVQSCWFSRLLRTSLVRPSKGGDEAIVMIFFGSRLWAEFFGIESCLIWRFGFGSCGYLLSLWLVGLLGRDQNIKKPEKSVGFLQSVVMES